jgi:hypothetical protein
VGSAHREPRTYTEQQTHGHIGPTFWTPGRGLDFYLGKFCEINLYRNKIIDFLGTIYRHIFIQNKVSETRLGLRLLPTQLGYVESGPKIAIISIDWTKFSRAFT